MGDACLHAGMSITALLQSTVSVIADTCKESHRQPMFAHVRAKQTDKVLQYLASQAGICRCSLSGTLLLLDGLCMLGDSSLHQDNLLINPTSEQPRV